MLHKLLELLLQKKSFCAVLPSLFLAVVTEHLVVSPNLLLFSFYFRATPWRCAWTVLGAEGSVQSLQCHCRHVTLPKQKRSCDYPSGDPCLLLTWTVWHWEVTPGCESLDEPLPSKEMDLWGSQSHPLRNFLIPNKAFPPSLAHIILSFPNSEFLCVMYLLRKEEIERAIDISWCHLTFLGKEIVELKEKNPLLEV